MNIKRIFPPLMLIAAVQSVTAEFALAAGDGGHSPSLAIYWFNFIVYVALLALVARKPLAKLLSARTETTREQIRSAKVQLLEAKARFERAQHSHVRLDFTGNQLTDQIKESAEIEAQTLLQAAELKSDRIIQHARDQADGEEREALHRVQSEATKLLLEQLRSRIATQHSEEADRRFRGSRVDKISALFDA